MMDTHSLISLLIQCLKAMSDNIISLSDEDKEIYYQEVKKLVRLIHSNYNQRMVANRPGVDEKALPTQFNDDFISRVNGRFVGLDLNTSKQRSKSLMSEDAYMQESSNFPNLSSLSPLLTMKTITHYPKLSLLLYDSLKPFMCIFDNEYLSFIDLCTKEKLLDFNCFQVNSA